MHGFAAPDGEGGIRVPVHPGPARAGATYPIRLAREDELDVVGALFGPGLVPYRGRGADWILDSYLVDLLDVRGRFEVAETYVAVQRGRIVGSIAFYPDVALEGWSNLPPGWSGFRALVVDPAVRGAGVGRALVEHCIARAKELGAPALGIHTVSLLTDAVRLYARVGFVRCPEFDLRAADVFPSAAADDMDGLAFRHDLA
jgi:GNAT superfamily N-acetyltransferase